MDMIRVGQYIRVIVLRDRKDSLSRDKEYIAVNLFSQLASHFHQGQVRSGDQTSSPSRTSPLLTLITRRSRESRPAPPRGQQTGPYPPHAIATQDPRELGM